MKHQLFICDWRCEDKIWNFWRPSWPILRVYSRAGSQGLLLEAIWHGNFAISVGFWPSTSQPQHPEGVHGAAQKHPNYWTRLFRTRNFAWQKPRNNVCLISKCVGSKTFPDSQIQSSNDTTAVVHGCLYTDLPVNRMHSFDRRGHGGHRARRPGFWFTKCKTTEHLLLLYWLIKRYLRITSV